MPVRIGLGIGAPNVSEQILPSFSPHVFNSTFVAPMVSLGCSFTSQWLESRSLPFHIGIGAHLTSATTVLKHDCKIVIRDRRTMDETAKAIRGSTVM